MNATAITILLLVISNVFMTIAWYGHLKMQSMGIGKDWPLFVVILFLGNRADGILLYGSRQQDGVHWQRRPVLSYAA